MDDGEDDLQIDRLHPYEVLPYGSYWIKHPSRLKGGARGKLVLALGGLARATVGVILPSFRITPLLYTKAKKIGHFSFCKCDVSHAV